MADTLQPMNSHPCVHVFPDLEALSRAAAERFVSLAEGAVPFRVALSGGSTPRRLYELLAAPPFRDQVPWPHTHLFWGDERCVPPDHPDSNYRMARESLLERAPIPARNVHRIRGELAPQEAAAAYEATLRTELGAGGRLDLVLLGMGEDGHTASLFPGSPALHEQTRWVMAQEVEKLGAWRITLTPPIINAAANVLFVVAGGGKAGRLRQALVRPGQEELLPAQMVRPAEGRLLWLVDRAAAGLLD
jgi:6-phosphogluconolactonase